MFSDIFNYFVIPTVVSIGAFGVYCLLNPQNGSNLLKNMAWQSVKLYSKASIYFENLAQPDTMEEDSDNENVEFENTPLLSYYNYDNDLEVHMGEDYDNLPEEWWKDSEKNVDLVLFKKQHSMDIFKTFKNYQDFNASDKQNWSTVEKQFVQIELVKENECIDIHKHLDSFYIEGNILFTPAFLKWYLQKWFNVSLDEPYTLRIFDKDVNLFDLTSEQYITITKEGYEVHDLDDDSENTEEEGTSSYEGAEED